MYRPETPVRASSGPTVPRRTALGIAAVYALFGSLWIITSDRLLPGLADSLEHATLLGMVKGLAFVLVTSLLLYAVLRIAPRRPEEARIPRLHGGVLAAVFLLLAAAILGIGYQVQQQNSRSMQQRHDAALRAVAGTTAGAVTAWLDEQRRWVRAAAGMGSIAAQLPATLAGDSDARAALLNDLESMRTGMELAGIVLTDPVGAVLLTAGDEPADELLVAAIRDAGAGRTGIVAGGEAIGTAGTWAFAHHLPGDDGVAGFLVTVVDPARGLGPVLNEWPLADSQGRSALATLGPGGELVLLPGLEAPQSNFASLPRIGQQPGLALAGRAATGVYASHLQDGSPVTLALARVGGANWVVASMLERSSTQAGTLLARDTALVVLLAITIAAALIIALFRQQQALSRALLDRAVRQRELLDQHFSYLTRFANDIVLLTDADGRIVNCNDRALGAYGLPRESLLGRSVLDLRPPSLVSLGRRQLSIARTEGSLVYETWHRRADGSEFPVEVSVRSFTVDGETFLQSILRDISERKAAEEELRLSELRFRNIFEHTGVGMAHVSPDGRLLMANPRFAELLGFAASELQGRLLEQLTVPADVARERPQFRALATGGRDEYTLQKRYRRKDGSELWAQLTASSMRDEHGRVQYLVNVVEDISTRKHLEAKLRRRTRLYRALSETNRLIARAAGLDELLSQVCKVAAAQADLPLAAMARYQPGQRHPTLLAAAGPDAQALAAQLVELGDRSSVFPPAADGDAGEQLVLVNDVEVEAVSSATRLACLRFGIRAYASFPLGSGGLTAARLAVFSREPGLFEGETRELLSDMARDLSGAVDKFRDRHRRSQAEERLREVAKRMSALIDAAPVAVFDLDAEGRVLGVWNPAAERMFGWRREEVIDRRLPVVPDQPDEQAHFDAVRTRSLQGESITGLEVCRQRRDGTPIHLSLSTSPIIGMGGRPAVLVVAEDITARHQAAAALRAAHDELEERVRARTVELEAARDLAEEADRIKTTFLASMSQELRTPLNSIISFSSLMLSGAPGAVNEEQEKQLNLIRDAGERLLSLIDDILDISRLQAADAKLPLEPTPLRDMLLRVLDGARLHAASRGLRLDAEIEACAAMAGPRRLEQVLAHLLNNAVRYTEQGSVTVRCRRHGDSVEIAVEDTGIGISAADQERLFRPFEALHKGTAGQGLGLALSRRLVEAMHGRISLDSEPGRGSVFTVWLGAAAAA